MEPLIADRNVSSLPRSIEDCPGGIVIPIDKPYRWTSADVIRKVKYAAFRHFSKKNLKVGHAGTLDPLATGVLLVCIGNATKLAEEMQRHDKEYVAGLTFGATTPSYDLEKDIDARYPYSHITEEGIRRALEAFAVGEQDQVAPLFSAKSVDGVRAYEMARKAFKAGEPIPDDILRAARIRIDECELMEFRCGLAALAAAGLAAAGDVVPDIDSAIGAASGIATGDCATLGIIRGGTACGGAERSEASSGAMPLAAETRTMSTAQSASCRINVADDDPALPHASIRIACSKGTYIRAFARDLGEALGSGAYLNSLRRSRSGGFRIKDAVSIEQALDLLG